MKGGRKLQDFASVGTGFFFKLFLPIWNFIFSMFDTIGAVVCVPAVIDLVETLLAKMFYTVTC